MKKNIAVWLGSLVGIFVLLMAGSVTAEEMGHTKSEEALGKAVFEKLTAKQETCATLSEEEFGYLGEYYMGLMMGESHEAMNEMIERMHGEEGEEEVHVVLGKRMSGCDPDASYGAYAGMGMMGGGGMMMGNLDSGKYASGKYGMMGGWGHGYGGWGFGNLFTSAFYILGAIAFALFIVKQLKSRRPSEN